LGASLYKLKVPFVKVGTFSFGTSFRGISIQDSKILTYKQRW
jgi:hypothetical protein